MAIKLYGAYASPWVRLVAAILKEKEVPYELVPVDFANKQHKSPEYLSKHPFGQIPYLVCDILAITCPITQRKFLALDRMMMDSFSTKAELSLTISRLSTLIKGHRYSQSDSKRMRFTNRLYS